MRIPGSQNGVFGEIVAANRAWICTVDDVVTCADWLMNDYRSLLKDSAELPAGEHVRDLVEEDNLGLHSSSELILEEAMTG